MIAGDLNRKPLSYWILQLNVQYKRAGGITFILGLALFLEPFYGYILLDIGVAPAFDPVEAVGFPGGYPVAVGSVAMTIGSAITWRTEQSVTIAVLAGGIVGAVLGSIAVTVLSSISVIWAIQIGLAGAAPGFATVRGAAIEQSRRRLGTGLIIFSLSPLAVGQLMRGVNYGGLAGAASSLLVITLIVYTAVLSYLFLRLGQIVQ